MSSKEIEHFIQHFERLTKANLATLPAIAEVVLALDNNHDCIRSLYKAPGANR